VLLKVIIEIGFLNNKKAGKKYETPCGVKHDLFWNIFQRMIKGFAEFVASDKKPQL
jgi:hypothetical protein